MPQAEIHTRIYGISRALNKLGWTVLGVYYVKHKTKQCSINATNTNNQGGCLESGLEPGKVMNSLSSNYFIKIPMLTHPFSLYCLSQHYR